MRGDDVLAFGKSTARAHDDERRRCDARQGEGSRAYLELDSRAYDAKHRALTRAHARRDVTRFARAPWPAGRFSIQSSPAPLATFCKFLADTEAMMR